MARWRVESSRDKLMKIAIGVLAYNAPDVLQQTLRFWPADLFTVFIHVDLKADIDAYRFVENHPNAHLIPNRFDIFWGGFNMVLAEIELMRLCAGNSGFDYFMLLSDDTVPLLQPDSMIEELRKDDNWKKHTPNNSDGIRRRYQSFVCYDVDACHPRHSEPERTFKVSDFEALFSLRLLMEKGKAPIADLFHSPQWMGLKAEDVRYIVDFHDNHPDIHRSFRFSSVPDEMYIQTILGSSPDERRHVEHFVFADFTRQPSPYLLETMSDLHVAFEKRYLFARKIRNPEFASALLQAGIAAG